MMKKKVLFMLSCVACLFCSLCMSCHDDEDDGGLGNSPSPSRVGTLADGGAISGISLYCIENYDTEEPKAPWFDYYPKTKTVPSYDSFTLCLMLDNEAPNYVASSNEEKFAIAAKEREYMKKKSSFMIDRYNELSQMTNGSVVWPSLYTAYVNGDVTITCDKTLFGKEPGADLSSYFEILGTEYDCVPAGVEAPQILYDFVAEKPKTVHEYFAKQTWLKEEYHLVLLQKPSEKYDELTFRLTLPMIKENVRNVVVSEYKGVEREVFTKPVYQTECKIKFRW